MGGERQGVEAVIKDTLLSQVILFAISNKSQVKRFQIDHDNQIYEDAMKRVARWLTIKLKLQILEFMKDLKLTV